MQTSPFKVYIQLIASLLAALLLVGEAHAARVINGVTLNGASNITVSPGDIINVSMTVTTNGSGWDDNWRSSGWRISTTPPGAITCENTANHNSDGTYTENFTITAPATAGVYNAYFIAYADNGCGFLASATYTMSLAITVGAVPAVSSITRDDGSPTNLSSVSWTVTFNESVTGVDSSDFTLVQGGAVSGASITSVSGSGTTWTVTANTGSGNGTLGLNLSDNDSIINGSSTPLGGAGAGNGDFTGEVYTIDKSAIVINTYYPGSASVAAGATSIVLGAANGASTPISTGDLLLIMQMQGASIDSSNTSSYGDGNSGDPGSGSVTQTAGTYEYIVATNDVPLAGGTLTVGCGLSNAYTNSNSSAAQGQQRFQVIRVPVYANYTLPALTAGTWNGNSGGVLAFDVTGNLNLNSATLSVDGLGFRGGGIRTSTSGSGNYTDYRTPALSNGANGSKGEGTAGTPYYVFTAPDQLTTNPEGEGYPNGSRARGAPGNAGGGATDRNPSSNDQNPGGGGGGNGGTGGIGGLGWCPTFNTTPPYWGCGYASLASAVNPNGSTGGFGGSTVSGLGATRLTMGGGGGSGTANNVTGSGACATINGMCTSGAAGGGIIMVRADTMSGSATFSANGSAADSSIGNDGSGGGGAGGAVMVNANSGMAGVTIDVQGGSGGSNLVPSSGYTSRPHGPGGGGGGGIALTAGATASCDANGGANGVTYNNGVYFGAYGATSGSTGVCNTSLSSAQIPGASLGGAGGCNNIDHFNINIGAGTASTCTPRAITITAEDSANNTITSFSETVSITTSTNHGDWSINSANGTLNNGSSDDGAASYNFVAADNGSVILDLTNTHADNLSITVSDPSSGVTTTSAAISFRDNAFVITPTSSYGATANSDLMVAGRDHNFEVAMWRRDLSTGDCSIASGYNSTTQGLKAYIDRGGELATAVDPELDDDTVTDVTLPEALPGINNITLDFSDTTGSGGTAAGIASFTLKTSDVGSYSLYLVDDSRSFATGTDILGDVGLVTAPFGFDIDFNGLRQPDFADGPLDGSAGDTSYALNASGSGFVAAGTDFDAEVTAVLWQAADDADNDGIPDSGANLTNNSAIHSFGNESGAHTVSFDALFFDPPEGGTNIANNKLTAPTLTAGGIGNQFSVGTANATATLNFDEVGIIDLSASLNNYLGHANADITGIAPNLGRFYADSFGVVLSAADFAPANTGFTYLGQDFRYNTAPTLTITALSAKGSTLNNYQGDYWKLGTSISGAGNNTFQYSDNVGGAATLSAPSSPANDIAFGDTSAVAGLLVVANIHAAADFSYQKPITPLAPFDADVALQISVQDSDGASGSDSLSSIGFTGDSDAGSGNPFNTTNDSLLRFGRAAINDITQEGTVAGTIANLPLEMQYYDGTDFIANSDDVTTTITHVSTTPAFTCIDPDGSDTLTCAKVTIADTVATHGATFPFTLNSSINAEGGTLVYTLDNVAPDTTVIIPDYLRFDWDDDGSIDPNIDKPIASVTFAPPTCYHGDCRFIYWREQNR